MAKRGIDMGFIIPNKEDYRNMQWCIKNGIKISPFAATYFDWFIDITINDKTGRSPQTYKKTIIWEKIFEFYKYYYNKNEDKL